MKRTLKTLLLICLVLLVMVALVGGASYGYLRASLPKLEGELKVAGLTAPLLIARDAQGIPTVQGESRADIAYGLGFLHAQERFFQMDLLRRNSAGELSEMLGAVTLSHDRAVRVHQFRKRATTALQRLQPAERRLLEAYTRGVNRGLEELARPPFEYALLRISPSHWQLEDTFLVLFSMYLDLQPELNEYERSLATLRDLLPEDWFHFLLPEGGQWDSPLDGGGFSFQSALPAEPLTQLLQKLGAETRSSPGSHAYFPYSSSWPEVGSNNWSVGGQKTLYTAAMLANDMHLRLNVPNIWYRASWLLPADGRRVTGASLPGVPVMVVGSNEHIAWGFTNSYGDFHDSIILQVNDSEETYLTPEGWQEFDREQETIVVKGSDDEVVNIRLTRWGPVIGRDHRNRWLALRWVAHDPEGANLGLLAFETSDNVDEALQAAAVTGIPQQNLNVVDRSGQQAWTIAGRLPHRFGFSEDRQSPAYPQDWSSGEVGWRGYRPAQEYPFILNPSDGLLWTANARVISGDMLRIVGRDRYALGARQQQIHKDLQQHSVLDEKTMLSIALDDRADFLSRWQVLLLNLEERSQSQTLAGSDRATVKRLLDNWEGRASVTSAGYLLVKRFREQVIAATTGRILEQVDQSVAFFEPRRVDAYLEYGTWSLITEQPIQHLPAGFESWNQLLEDCLARAIGDLTADGRALTEHTWGDTNQLDIRHPLTRALPVLGYWLNMPAEPMPGDTFMPRVQRPSMGASQRMVISPGQEKSGIFHMATGQSSHPLSPFFGRRHRDWVEGRASPFLPGETQWRLTLTPEQ